MSSFVSAFQDIDKTKLMLVGGKGANLGELSRLDGLYVPDGFCLSTAAFQQTLGETSSINVLLDQLTLLKLDDRQKIAALSAELRGIITALTIPHAIREEVILSLSRLGEDAAYAVRSSSTAEDLPTASFAGQQDTFLNIIGREAILQHISKCWASLFTDRAVIYRIQHGFDHKKVSLAVVIQKMVYPQAAGIMFTADPITANRKLLSIDASFGLGEALVSGLVSADCYKVRSEEVVARSIATKKLAIYALPTGGTEIRQLAPEQQMAQTLTDQQILRLARLGRQIEAHFACPQDIEWCLADDAFFILQSRPITTLFPIPAVHDGENHVYISVGHQQMMTDAMKPFGISFWQLTTARPMPTSGGRLFVDVTPDLASPTRRPVIMDVLGKDPLLKDALTTILEREDFIRFLPAEQPKQVPGKSQPASPQVDYNALNDYDPSIVSDLMKRSQDSIEALKLTIQTKSGPALFDFILEDIQRLKQILFDPQSSAVFLTAMNASAWINEKMLAWLDEKGAADTLSQSVPHNITSEMGLALLDVADVLRPYPAVIHYLQQTQDENFLDALPRFPGGQACRSAILAYLTTYGMRCVGEIDITRTRWSEKPAILIPLLLSNLKNFAPGAGQRKFEQGRQEALQKAQELLERLRQLPDCEQKARETQRMIHLVRNFIGYREYPKYGMIRRYFIYKQAFLQEAAQLVQDYVLSARDDIYYLTFAELHEAVRTRKLDYTLIDQRKADYNFYAKLTPPRVLTSDGEIIMGEYKREHLPAHALVGLAVSSGMIEGRARVIFNLEDANLESGDILVTSFTDPSWTPLFVSIKGLVTEVGGLMTHGAVIAREYGLPAVVNVGNATRLIKDGQRIRVNGTEGYIELL